MMKTTQHLPNPKSRPTGENRGNGGKESDGLRLGESLSPSVRRNRPSLRSLLFRSLPLSGAILAFCAATPRGWTQYQVVPVYPQPSVLTGPTQGATLRNAAAATSTQAGIVRKWADDWGRRAGWPTYRAEHFQSDFASAQMQFFGLRQQFNVLGNLALQLGRPRADNAVAELDAGLNIIAELFTFLQTQFNVGTLDHKTIVRTCRALEDAMREWEREFKRNSSRIGLLY